MVRLLMLFAVPLLLSSPMIAQVRIDAPVDRQAMLRSEQAAAEEWVAFLAERHPAPRDRAAFEARLAQRLDQLAAFARNHPGTLAGYEATHRIGLIQIHALDRPDLGLSTMGAVHRALQLRPPPQAGDPVLPGMSFDPQRYFLLYARGLAEFDRYDDAALVLLPYLKREDPSGELARALDLEIRQLRPTAPGQTFPDFTAMDATTRQPLALSSQRGHPLLLVYWSRLDPPCLRLLPLLEQLRRRYENRGLQVLGIPIEEDENHLDALTQVWRDLRLGWPQLVQSRGWRSRLVSPPFTVRSVPALFLLDANGVVRLRQPDLQELEQALAEMLPPSSED